MSNLEQILHDYDTPGRVVDTKIGPVVYTHHVDLEPGVRVRKIVGLGEDLALRLGVDAVRVVQNVTGLPYVGVEVPRPDRQIVPFLPVSREQALPLTLGVDTTGASVTVDLADAPHLLVAGATGSGKSVALHTMLCSLLSRWGRPDLRLILVDPKQLEFPLYNAVHRQLVYPVITDMSQAVDALTQGVDEMERRYTVLAQSDCRDIGEYRARGGVMPYIVYVIDEWADLYTSRGKVVERPLIRLAQKARASGIHIILATQRPTVKVVSGLIKANFPARIALRVTSKTDSRVILDQNGAEALLGRGDMLVSGFGQHAPRRVHGAYVDAAQFLGR